MGEATMPHSKLDCPSEADSWLPQGQSVHHDGRLCLGGENPTCLTSLLLGPRKGQALLGGLPSLTLAGPNQKGSLIPHQVPRQGVRASWDMDVVLRRRIDRSPGQSGQGGGWGGGRGSWKGLVEQHVLRTES